MENQTLEYAKSELKKYSELVFGQELAVDLLLKEVVSELDDGYEISVRAGKGRILANNVRSALMGVYGLFYEMGCRWIRPSKGGDYLVKRRVDECNVEKTFTPKYRHRGICSEGAISEENLTDMVEWAPKMNLNSFFLQFSDGHLFFEKWYRHLNSGKLQPEEYSAKDSAKHYQAVVREIKRRGLYFHAVGHGWTTEPLGYVTYGDKRSTEADIRAEDRELFALVDGKRGFFVAPGDTHLCYSNPKARDMMTNAVVEYLKAHQEVDALHFWLADNINNHCECENCIQKRPADFYVKMLNELDEKLTENKITAKIVFLIYCDLLFPPKEEKINNPDRFIMMYAPIARNYFEEIYKGGFIQTDAEKPEYVRNKNRHPKNKEEYLHHLKNWQEVVQCDSFAFEYHLMIFQYGKELSSLRVAKTIDSDMTSLCEVGINGNISCQLQRISLPTFLPNYVMAKRLSGETQTFEEILNEYLVASFGEKKTQILAFLERVERFFSVEILEKDKSVKERAAAIEGFEKDTRLFLANTDFNSESEVTALSLKIMRYFAEILIKFLAALKKKTLGEEYKEAKKELFDFIDENELEYQKYFDVVWFKLCVDEFMDEQEVVL